MVLRLGSVDFFEKEEVDQQAVDEEIVDPQAVKKQDAGQDRDRHDSGPDDFGEGARRFVIQANQAITGERRANTVQPMMKVRLYTPRVRAAVA